MKILLYHNVMYIQDRSNSLAFETTLPSVDCPYKAPDMCTDAQPQACCDRFGKEISTSAGATSTTLETTSEMSTSAASQMITFLQHFMLSLCVVLAMIAMSHMQLSLELHRKYLQTISACLCIIYCMFYMISVTVILFQLQMDLLVHGLYSEYIWLQKARHIISQTIKETEHYLDLVHALCHLPIHEGCHDYDQVLHDVTVYPQLQVGSDVSHNIVLSIK